MVKIFVVSDTHGNIDEFIRFVKPLEKPDLIIHLGDYVEDSLAIEKSLNVKTIKVKGNCDFSQKGIEEEIVLDIEGKRIFATHGHNYDVKMGILNVFYKAKEEKIDLVLYGHTHKPSIVLEEGITFLNPGSPSMPRGLNKRTFAIIDIDKKINSKIIEIN